MPRSFDVSVARFYPGDLKILSTETWRPIGGRRVRGEVNIAEAGAPGSSRGAALLVPMGNRSQLSFNGTVEFKVPLVGGKIESYLGGPLAEQIRKFSASPQRGSLSMPVYRVHGLPGRLRRLTVAEAI